MMRSRRTAWIGLASLVAIIVGLATGGSALAAKPGSGGSDGGGAVPLGTIYFEQGDNSFTGRSMLADGSAKADSLRGEPSYQPQGGLRWFLTSHLVIDETDGSEHADLLVVAEDGSVVPLGLDAREILGSRWAKDDSFLSYVAILDTPEGASAGLFVAQVDWSFGTPVVATPEKILHINLYDGYYPDFYFWDWSPSGDELVYMLDQQGSGQDPVFSLKVVKFFADGTAETRNLVSDALYPQWSPDGSRVAFHNYVDGAIWTIRLDGSGASKMSSPKSGSYHTEPSWSPDSKHLVFTQVTRNRLQKGDFWYTYTYDVFRVTATGSGPTNLTGDTDEDCFAIAWR